MALLHKLKEAAQHAIGRNAGKAAGVTKRPPGIRTTGLNHFPDSP